MTRIPIATLDPITGKLVPEDLPDNVLIAITDRGAWAAGTQYHTHDLVTYGGTTWLVEIAHVSASTFDDTKFTELNSYRGAWQANTRYESGDQVINGGSLYSANSTFTSGSSFNPTNWTQLTSAVGVSSFNTRTGAVTLSKADVTGTGLAASDVGADASGAAASAQAASLQKSSNLSDVASASTARTNLGLGTAATHAVTDFDTAGAAAAAQAASDPSGAASAAQAASLQKTSNLSDVAVAATARTNLGLGSAATHAATDFDTAGAAAAAQAAAIAASAQGLTPTAVKTAAYSAAVGDFVPVDISAGSMTVTLPNAPADKTRIGVKVIKVDGSHANAATVARAGSDVFNVAAGSTSLTLSALFQGVLLQYSSSAGIWYVSTADTPVGQPGGAGSLDANGRQPIAQTPLSVESARSGNVTPTALASTYGAKGDGVILYNAVMTAGSAVLNASDAAFTSADVGKTIIVSGVGASNEALVTTIQTFTSATQVTLAASATVNSPDPAGVQIAIYGTDDTAAIQAASDAAATSNTGTLEFDSKIYVIAGALQQGGARKTNAQITLPNGGQKGQVGRLIWKGAREFTGYMGAAPFPTPGGTILVSTLIGGTYSGTYGIPSVVGGPTALQTSSFSGWLYAAEDLCVLTPRNPSLSAFNLEQTSACNFRRVIAGTLAWSFSGTASGYDPLTALKPSNAWAAAFINPMVNNFQGGAGRSDQICTWGYFAGIVPGDHTDVTHYQVMQTRIPIAIRGTSFNHCAKFGYICCQTNPYVISGWDPSQSNPTNAIKPVGAPPSTGAGVVLIDCLDLEDYSDTSVGNDSWTQLVAHVNDTNNHLNASIRFKRWTYLSSAFTYASSLVVSGGAGVQTQEASSAAGTSNLAQAVYDAAMPWLITVNPLLSGADVESVQGTWTLQIDSTAVLGAYIFNSSLVQHDGIAYELPLAAGTWNLALMFRKAPAAAIFTVKLDGVSIGTIDAYAASGSNNNQGTITGFSVATSGKHKISFVADTRNASATSWNLPHQMFQLRRTA